MSDSEENDDFNNLKANQEAKKGLKGVSITISSSRDLRWSEDTPLSSATLRQTVICGALIYYYVISSTVDIFTHQMNIFSLSGRFSLHHSACHEGHPSLSWFKNLHMQTPWGMSRNLAVLHLRAAAQKVKYSPEMLHWERIMRLMTASRLRVPFPREPLLLKTLGNFPKDTREAFVSLYVTLSLSWDQTEAKEWLLRWLGRDTGQSQSSVCGPFVSHVCLCVCMFMCVCMQCVGLSQRAKHSSPHGHNGTAQAHQTLNIVHFTMHGLFYQCLFKQRAPAGGADVTNTSVATLGPLR